MRPGAIKKTFLVAFLDLSNPNCFLPLHTPKTYWHFNLFRIPYTGGSVHKSSRNSMNLSPRSKCRFDLVLFLLVAQKERWTGKKREGNSRVIGYLTERMHRHKNYFFHAWIGYFFFGKCGRGFDGCYRAILGGINDVRHGLSSREWYALRCLLYWNCSKDCLL